MCLLLIHIVFILQQKKIDEIKKGTRDCCRLAHTTMNGRDEKKSPQKQITQYTRIWYRLNTLSFFSLRIFFSSGLLIRRNTLESSTK